MKKAPAKKTATKRATAKRSGRVVSAPTKSVTSLHVRPQWTTACPDWKKRIVARQPLTPSGPIFPEEAEEAWQVYSALQMVDQGGAGEYPTFGELSRKWTRDFVDAVFGSYCGIRGHELEGRRLIKNFFMLISKKNGKSTLAAGIMLTALILNWRDQAEFIILSPTKEIADNSFKPIEAAIKADAELSAILHVQPHLRLITHRDTGATLKVVAADSQTVSGKKAVGILVDELHEFGKIAKAGEMLTEATGGLMSRPEGFVIYLTTQSAEPPAGVFKDKLTYARKVRDGKIEDNTFYPIIYEFPSEMLKAKAHKLPENFYITNPNMGASVDEEYLISLMRTAKLVSEKELQDKEAKHLNIEVGAHLADDNWPGLPFWLEQGVRPEITLEYIIQNCEVIALGFDGGGLDDLFGGNVLGREIGTGKLLSWEFAAAHPSVMTRRQEIAPRLQDFANDGDLLLVEKIGDDKKHMINIARRLEESGLLCAVGMDPAMKNMVLEALDEAGVPEDKIFMVSQGYRLAGNIKACERLLAEGVLQHRGRPMMAWCAANAKVVVRGNAIVITKQVSGTAKIDPLMALFCSVEIMASNPPAQNSNYDFSMMTMVG